MHLPRPRRDVDADGALETVRFPLDHVAVLCARAHEAVGVAFVAAVVAAAEAGNVRRDFGMFGRELKRRSHELVRAGRRVGRKWDRREGWLIIRTEVAQS